MRVLDHHDGRVDHRPDGDGDATQAHDVAAHAQRAHGDESDQDADRQGQDGDQCAPDVHQKNHADDRDDQTFFEQGVLEIVNRALDQAGSVIDRDDVHAFRQPGFQFLDLGLDVGDDIERILAEARHDDTRGDFAFAVQFRDAAPASRHQFDLRHIADQYRRAAVALEDQCFDVFDAFQVTEATDHEFLLGHFDHPAADIPI